jgi:GABA permease/aromatic amino acid permease
MGAARLLYVLARERHLPAVLSATSAAGVPVAAILVVAVTALASALLIVDRDRLTQFALASATIVCVVYTMFLAAAARLRASQPHRARPFRSPLPAWMLWVLAAGFAFLIAENLRRSVIEDGSWLAAAPIVLAAVAAGLFRRRTRAPLLPTIAESSKR